MLDIESTALIQLLIAERSAEKPGLKNVMQDVTEECERSGKEAYEVIENFGLFTKEEMLQIMAENLGSYVWDPRGTDITQDVITIIDVDFARKHGVIPIAMDEDTICMGMKKPLDFQTVEAMQFILNKKIVPCPCDPILFDGEMERYYP